MERQRWLLEHRAEGTVTASRGEGLLHGEQGRVGGAVAGGPREGRMACALVGPRGGREGLRQARPAKVFSVVLPVPTALDKCSAWCPLLLPVGRATSGLWAGPGVVTRRG